MMGRNKTKKVEGFLLMGKHVGVSEVKLYRRKQQKDQAKTIFTLNEAILKYCYRSTKRIPRQKKKEPLMFNVIRNALNISILSYVLKIWLMQSTSNSIRPDVMLCCCYLI